MVYVGIIERENSFTVDGYCKAKTIKGAIAEFGRYIRDNISELEGKTMIEYKEEALACISEHDANNNMVSYFFTIEEVSCASQINDETDEMEYKEGYNFYVCCRLVK